MVTCDNPVCLFELVSSVCAPEGGDAAREAACLRTMCYVAATSQVRASDIFLLLAAHSSSHRHAHMCGRRSAEFEPSISTSDDHSVTVVIFGLILRT
jgi:hypothetical protein